MAWKQARQPLGAMNLPVGRPGGRASFAGAVLLAASLSVAAQSLRPTVILVGDSTMATRNGYGDALCQRLEPAVACINLARNGRSTQSFRAEGRWDTTLKLLRTAGDASRAHVLIQFGHNDQPGKPGRSTDLVNEYPANLERYVQETREAGAVPVLVTPLTRRSFVDSQLTLDLAPWALAMRQVARAQQVAMVDLFALSAAHVQQLGQTGADEMAMAEPGGREFDRTHLGAKGACVFAQMMSLELAKQVPALALPRSSAPACDTLPGPPAHAAARTSPVE